MQHCHPKRLPNQYKHWETIHIHRKRNLMPSSPNDAKNYTYMIRETLFRPMCPSCVTVCDSLRPGDPNLRGWPKVCLLLKFGWFRVKFGWHLRPMLINCDQMPIDPGSYLPCLAKASHERGTRMLQFECRGSYGPPRAQSTDNKTIKQRLAEDLTCHGPRAWRILSSTTQRYQLVHRRWEQR